MPDPSGFRFTLSRATEAERDLDLQIAALDSHIDKVNRTIEVNGIPLITAILGLTHDEKELNRIADALKLIAPYVSKLDKLNLRKKVFNLAREDAFWLESAFGDIDGELDKLILDNLKKD